MRKVRLAINVSMDGYVARPNGKLDWVFRTMTPAQQAWTTAFLREVDTILIGAIPPIWNRPLSGQRRPVRSQP